MEPQIWAEIRRLRQIDKRTISDIARQLLLDRKTVRRALRADTAPGDRVSPGRRSKLDEYKAYIGERITRYPRLPATAVYEEIKQRGYTGKVRILREYMAGIKQTETEAFVRITTLPGEFGQVDWAHCGTVQIGTAARKLSCFVMVLSYSRLLYLEFRLSQCLEDFIQCHINAFRFFGGIPKKVLYDNVKTVVISRLGSAIQFNPQFAAFAGSYLFEPVCCNPGRGNEKGIVESGIKYIRTSFLMGRTITWPGINADACQWRDEIANVRQHAVTHERPVDRFEQEKPLLIPLPEHDYDASVIRTLKASSQALIHFDGNTYSVPYAYAYKAVVLKGTCHEVTVWDGMIKIARHRRSYERGLVIEDPAHYAGLIAEKKKAFASKLKDHFLSLGVSAQAYLDGLLNAELHLPHHIAGIMECVRLYGKTEVLQAIEHALHYKAYGAPYLKNIILQQRAARGMKQPLPIIVPAKPDWTELCIEQQDLSLYDELYAAEPAESTDPEEPLSPGVPSAESADVLLEEEPL
jgi:transposase